MALASRIASSQEHLLQAQLQQLRLKPAGTAPQVSPSRDLSAWSADPDPMLSSFNPLEQGDVPSTSPWEAPVPAPAPAPAQAAPGPRPGAPPSTAAPPPLPLHRRGASETMNAFRFPSSQPAAFQRTPRAPSGGVEEPGAPTMPLAYPNVEQQQLAIQQQIEQLQQQQQQLMRQQQQLQQPLPPVGEARESPGSLPSRIQAHRRIQSQSASSTYDAGQGRGGSMRGVPAHRRHMSSRGSGGAEPAPQESHMLSNPDFSFPPRHVSDSMAPMGMVDPAQPGARVPGHARNTSYQLSSNLSPEFLVAGGGLLNVSSLGLGGAWGDSSGEPPAAESHAQLGLGYPSTDGVSGRRPRTGHGRSSSTSSATWRQPSGGAAPGLAPLGTAPVAQSGRAFSGELMSNLAQAQSQLAALHRSRMQASSGTHSRSASYSGQRSLSGGSVGGGGGQGAPRKALFGTYLPQSSLPPLLITGRIVVGILRVNKRNRSDAWVSTEVLDQDIFISGSKDRNRALEGDLVAVELLDPVEVWNVKKEKEDKKKRKEESGAAPANPARRLDKVRDDLDVEGAQLTLLEDEEENTGPPAVAGHVVAIVERTPGQIFPGTLGLLRPSSAATKEKQQAERGEAPDEPPSVPAQRPKIVWFRPSDKRVPLIAIPADQAPDDFWKEGAQDKYAHALFMASIKRWPITSLHPFGTLVERLGTIGALEAESAAVLKSFCAGSTLEFPEMVQRAAHRDNWQLPETEYALRRSFGATAHAGGAGTTPPGTVVLAVDEAEGDLALSVSRLDNGLAQVGIHVVDVSFFIKPGSPLDREAKKRGETVTLPAQKLPLFPPAFVESVAFAAGADRLAKSVVLTIALDQRVTDSWVGESVVRCTHAVAPAAMERVLHGGDAPGVADEARDALAVLAAALEPTHGALMHLHDPRVAFRLEANGMPADVQVHEGRCIARARALLDELRYRAEYAVALHVSSTLPDSALLRLQRAPRERALQQLRAQTSAMGHELDLSSAHALAQSVAAIQEPDTRAAVEVLVRRTLEAGKYFCTGMVDIANFSHYALQAPVYTHFAAPLRRYADVCVHRQLDAALRHNEDAAPAAQDGEGVAKTAQQCNVKRTAVQLAQEQSTHLYICFLVHRRTQERAPVTADALVLSLGESSLNVFVPAYGVEKRVHLDLLPLQAHRLDPVTGTLRITWRHGVHSIAHLSQTMDDACSKALWQRVQETQGAAARSGAAADASQAITALSRVPVHLVADLEKSPPNLKVVLANPLMV